MRILLLHMPQPSESLCSQPLIKIKLVHSSPFPASDMPVSVCKVRQDSITRWLQRRASAVRSLRLRGSGDLEGALVPMTDRPHSQSYVEHPRIHDFNRQDTLLIMLLPSFSSSQERCGASHVMATHSIRNFVFCVLNRMSDGGWHSQLLVCDMCRFGLAAILTTVVVSLEELVIERCYDLITTAAFRGMGGCKKLKVSCGILGAHLSERRIS